MDQSPGGARTLFAGGGHKYAFNNISTVAQRVVNASAQRKRIMFHNPGPNDIFVFPTTVQNNGVAPLPAGVGSDTVLAASLASLGGTLRVFGSGGSLIVEAADAAYEWQAFATTGTTNPLTVMNSNA